MVADVNVTCIPAQTGFAEGEMVMLTGFSGLTIICMELDIAGLFEIQAVIDEVKMQDTRSPDAGL
jgi:tetrahydromethanopterin S-methyltransferase subunit C